MTTLRSPLVSVVIPTLNARRWLGEAIDSVLEQTYRRLEIVVVDDGSTDGTAEWVRHEYGDRVRLHVQENEGVAEARNKAIELSKGKYIAFLDADDVFYDEEKIEKQVGFLEQHPDYAVAYTDVLKFREFSEKPYVPWKESSRYREGDVLADLLDGGSFLIITAMMRREWVERVGGFDSQLRSNEDWDYMLRLALKGARFAYYPRTVGALYRKTPGSRSSAGVDHAHSGVEILTRIERRLKVEDPERYRGLRGRIRRAIGKWRFAYGAALYREERRVEGWFQMLRGLLMDPRGLHYKLYRLTTLPALGASRSDALLERLTSTPST